MIDNNSINELKAFFANLPRPLPNKLKLNDAETVTDPDTFIEAQLSVFQERRNTAHGELVLARLLRWKELYGNAVESK